MRTFTNVTFLCMSYLVTHKSQMYLETVKFLELVKCFEIFGTKCFCVAFLRHLTNKFWDSVCYHQLDLLEIGRVFTFPCHLMKFSFSHCFSLDAISIAFLFCIWRGLPASYCLVWGNTFWLFENYIWQFILGFSQCFSFKPARVGKTVVSPVINCNCQIRP